MLDIPDIQNLKLKGGISKLEGPLFTSKQERQALLTMFVEIINYDSRNHIFN